MIVKCYKYQQYTCLCCIYESSFNIVLIYSVIPDTSRVPWEISLNNFCSPLIFSVPFSLPLTLFDFLISSLAYEQHNFQHLGHFTGVGFCSFFNIKKGNDMWIVIDLHALKLFWWGLFCSEIVLVSWPHPDGRRNQFTFICLLSFCSSTPILVYLSCSLLYMNSLSFVIHICYYFLLC